ncbi:MAG: hypothetical protein MZV63_14670 [Marinilabiliales bacterium]|nr:hypothetical protein [Marinilabiliales bacterium]
MIEKGPLLIVRFHPECEHCHYEISSLLKSDAIPSEAKVLLISSACRDSIQSFLKRLDFSGNRSITVLADAAFSFGSIFGSESVPVNYVYDRNLKLEKVFYGEVKIETLINHLTTVE